LGQCIGPIFKGQDVQEEEFLTLEDGTDELSQNFGKGLPFKDFLTLEDGTSGLSGNVSKGLPFDTV
jgi:hypothetical protein